MDPFDVLGLPPRLDLDPSRVERAYLARVAGVHPDLSEDSAGAAAALNDARGILADPRRRAEALLDRLHPGALANSKAMPAGFLAEIMEARLDAEQSIESRDSDAVARWLAWCAERAGIYESALAGLLPPAPERPDRAAESVVLLNAWRYIQRMADQLSAVDESQPPRSPA